MAETINFDPLHPTKVSVAVADYEERLQSGGKTKKTKSKSSTLPRSPKTKPKLNQIKITTIEEQRGGYNSHHNNNEDHDEEITTASSGSTLNKNSHYDDQKRKNFIISNAQRYIMTKERQKEKIQQEEGLEFLCSYDIDDAKQATTQTPSTDDLCGGHNVLHNIVEEEEPVPLEEETRADSESAHEHHHESRMMASNFSSTPTVAADDDMDILDTVFESVESSMGCGGAPRPFNRMTRSETEEILFQEEEEASSSSSESLPMLAGEQIDEITNLQSAIPTIKIKQRFGKSITSTNEQYKRDIIDAIFEADYCCDTPSCTMNPGTNNNNKDIIDTIFESDFCWCGTNGNCNEYPSTDELTKALSMEMNQRIHQYDIFDQIFEPVEELICEHQYKQLNLAVLHYPYPLMEVNAFTDAITAAIPYDLHLYEEGEDEEVKEQQEADDEATSKTSTTAVKNYNNNRQLVAMKTTVHRPALSGGNKDLLDVVFDTVESSVCGQDDSADSLLVLTTRGGGDSIRMSTTGSSIHNWSVQRRHELEKPVLPEPEDDLLWVVAEQQDCLKCSPVMFLTWLYTQDIVTVADLREACFDNKFVEYELIPNGGLKRFKRGKFIQAVEAAAIAQAALVSSAAAASPAATRTVVSTNSDNLDACQRANSM